MHEVFCDVRCELGEGPWWSARENALYWVDILGRTLYRRSLDEHAVDRWAMPETIGWVVERRDEAGFIAGLASGFHLLTLEPFRLSRIVDPEPELPDNRMNDAKVDHLGRIWAGTMDARAAKPTGSLYRLDPDMRVTRQDGGYLVTNGPAFDAPRRRLYHNDTGRRVVYCFDLSPEGALSGKREFIRFREEWGYPDGMTVDGEGGLWIAHWDGGRVTRFSPYGEPERHVALPASRITSCTFGGQKLDRLFITSAADGRAEESMAGLLFEVDPGGVVGVPPNRFAG